ncbi:putative O-methyltransferase YrrM [Sphingomonas naasensis]|uniref:Class I SAM-dependent methyltransferase n=1 Tax=Sphingomonas naasensis TaxID=1344951 RepID=A0A4S1WRK5_9SPHN|nr:class I SAM-dependent methyltransferase [Sphingomonas naasensis]NIJ18771.1 putative O-methyltransferase YrrM [Sphingomonas naasensis]TGX46004.1 class I SAM-dependent methyltransferase [Sphingomonas naasensis]
MTMPALLRPSEILATMRGVGGWLEDSEAELLLAAAAWVTRGGGARTLVEIGSYQGRSTVVLGAALRALSPESRLYAIDPHQGTVGAADRRLSRGTPTFDAFCANIEGAGVARFVEPVRSLSYEVAWSRPIDLLFVDGLHDRLNVERDFRHFAPFLAPSAAVLFHDYASYYPGVVAFVDEIVAREGWEVAARAGSMIMVHRPEQQAAQPTPAQERVVSQVPL